MPQRIEVPGQGLVEFPDGMSDADIVKAIQAHSTKPIPASGGLSSVAGDVLAGAVRGAGSIGATILEPVDSLARRFGVQNEYIGRTDRRQAMDDALRGMGADTNSLAFKGGKLGAEIAGTSGVGGVLAKGGRLLLPAATQAVPAVANVIRAVETAGASGGGLIPRSVGAAINGLVTAGMVNPDDALSGGVVGAATPSVVGLAGKAGNAIADLVRPNAQANPLARKAVDKYGIPLAPADVTDSRAVKGVRSFLSDLPVIGRPAQSLKEQQTKAFNKAVGGTFGAAEESLTPQVMDQAKRRLGSEFDRIWNNNVLQVDGQMFQKITDLDTQAMKLPKQEGESLRREIQDLLSKVQQDQQGGLFVPGDVANKFQSYLRRRAEGSAGLRNELTDLRQTVIGAFNRSVNPADAAALTQNRAMYKAFKTVEPLLNSAEVGVAGRVSGDVPVALLPNAVNRSYSNPAGVPLADLSAIGSRFLVDRTPQTGGSARAMIQNSALGTGLALGGWTNPVLAGGGLLSMGGISKALNSPTVGRALMNPAPQVPTGLLYRASPLLLTQ